MKTINEHLYWGKKYLDDQQIPDANLSTKILLSFATNIPTIDFIRNPETEITAEQSKKFKELITKRGEDFPVAYLTGEKEFYSLRFEVTPSVLIPRPETETLIDWFGEKSEIKISPYVMWVRDPARLRSRSKKDFKVAFDGRRYQ